MRPNERPASDELERGIDGQDPNDSQSRRREERVVQLQRTPSLQSPASQADQSCTLLAPKPRTSMILRIVTARLTAFTDFVTFPIAANSSAIFASTSGASSSRSPALTFRKNLIAESSPLLFLRCLSPLISSSSTSVNVYSECSANA